MQMQTQPVDITRYVIGILLLMGLLITLLVPNLPRVKGKLPVLKWVKNSVLAKGGHLNISFWWRLIAILLAIGVVLAIKPEIITAPWEQNKLETVLGALLLLGLLIQWATQTYKGEKKEAGSLLTGTGLVLLIAAGFACVWWVYKAANTMDERSGRERVGDAPAPPPVPIKTWHNLTGGLEKTLTLTGEWSEEIRVAPKHEITWDDWYPNIVLRVNKTNVMDSFSGIKTNTAKFETVEFKSKDGTPITIKVATGAPKSGS